MKIEQLYNKFLECVSVSTDSRSIEEGAMYFALKGDNFDGNKFAQQAKEKGTRYCIVDNSEISEQDSDFILVDDVLNTLQALAKHHRQQLKYPIIALTGSNGKTTTKELIYAVLSKKYKVKATIGNLNNHIGVPLTLLRFRPDDDFGIVEMGANHQKEIIFLCSIAQPDYGLITNFGKAHLEGFGSIEGVIKGKSELYDYLKSNNKTAFINSNDTIQTEKIGSYDKVISFGSDVQNDISIQFISANPFVNVKFKDVVISSHLIGSYNYANIAVAIALGDYFKVNLKGIENGIENYSPDNNRSQIIEKANNKIILDAYNANPTSMLAALENFKNLEAKQKFLFLGDMFELGNTSTKEHQAIVDYIESNFETSTVFLTGKHFASTIAKSNIKTYNSFDDLKAELKHHSIKNASILIKGSRGMALERVLEIL
ncbi:UDP-N-acetylmuramoyl-tripeptide--D-alanyl-D-alanine ligase [Winogradskyella sp. A3E31]|uniref:UDP-N-acetylmuramoyl-tripeptide--D-alanyl-D- alanine ligase n=1 Tax=Winogradskyella sp. A3E31 TaxID=3349637 RepID=UPI00398A8D26